MQLLILVIFFVAFSHSSALLCLKSDNGEVMQFDLNSDDSKMIHEKLRELTFDHGNGTKTCRIELYIDYEENQLVIKFTENMTKSILKDEHVRIDLLVTGDYLDEITIHYYLEYACSDDQCDLHFILNYTSWFIDGEEPDLIEHLTPYILNDEDADLGEYFIKCHPKENECYLRFPHFVLLDKERNFVFHI